MSTPYSFMTDIYDNSIPLHNDSTACLSPPLDGSEEIHQDLFNNELAHQDRDWLSAYEAKPPKNDMDKSRKQALAAKLNREKKKKYVSGLERRVQTLLESDKLYRENLQFANNRVVTLEREVSYLKAVLQHDSKLSKLLCNVPNTQGIKFESLISPSKPRTSAKRKLNETTIRPASQTESNQHDHDNNDAAATSYNNNPNQQLPPAPGICLHISEENVTIELCPECSRKATNLKQ